MKQKAISLSRNSFWTAGKSKITIEIIVAILLIIWLHTGISKLIDYRSFRIQMYQSRIFHDYAAIVTYSGPLLEIVLAILLIFKKTRIWGLAGSFLLMCFFTWYVTYLMITLPHLPCSCGGIVGFLNWPQHLALNIFLTLISLIGFILVRRQKKTDRIEGSIKSK